MASYRYLLLSLAVALAFLVVKMLIAQWYAISNLTSLIVIGSIVGLGWLASAIERWRLARTYQLAFDPQVVPLALRAFRLVRRVLVLIVGGTIVMAGIAMIVLPGPATLVIPFGLSILALEFVWARRCLERLYERLNRLVTKQRDDSVQG